MKEEKEFDTNLLKLSTCVKGYELTTDRIKGSYNKHTHIQDLKTIYNWMVNAGVEKIELNLDKDTYNTWKTSIAKYLEQEQNNG